MRHGRRVSLALGAIMASFLLMVGAVFIAYAQSGLYADEKQARVTFTGTDTQVTLTFINRTGDQPRPAKIQLALLTPSGNQPVLTADANVVVGKGAQSFKFILPVTADDLATSQLPWYRLRYVLTAPETKESDGKTLAPVMLDGVVSLSEICQDFFELKAFLPQNVRAGQNIGARVLATDRVTHAPRAGVNVKGKLYFDEEEDDAEAKDKPVYATGVTDDTGYALLTFTLPKTLATDDADLEITATDRGLSAKVSEDFDLYSRVTAQANTDKPIYQPGQTLHYRAVVFNAARRAVPDKNFSVIITDPDNLKTYRAEMKSTRFGVVNADWQIPTSTRLGSYEIELKDTDADDTIDSQRIKISRYELPNFVVQVEPDRKFYLPQETTALVTVRADYLFGQPVKRGRVRVVREEDRTWNYREQKYEIKEGDKYEGATDADGKFVARVKLGKFHEQIKDSTWRRFQDVSFAAYFTDPTTNRTEQRCFDLRVTREPVHVYAVSVRSYDVSSRLPFEFYITASYADGAPAACDVTLNGFRKTDSRANDDDPKALQHFHAQTVRTNAFGAARVAAFNLPRNGEGNSDGDDRIVLRLAARDAKEQRGTHAENFSTEDKPALRVATDKTIYRAGEPVRVEIESSEHARAFDAFVDIVKQSDYGIVRGERVRISNGRGALTLPPGADLRGELKIGVYAYPTDEDGDDEGKIGDTRNIIFPYDDELQLDVAADKTEYLPGAPAEVNFAVRTADGRATESALGVVVFDRAVEERARTDSEFGGGYFGFYRGYGNDGALAGLTVRNLNKLDLSKPLPNGMETAADALLNQSRNDYYPNIESDVYDKNYNEIFAAHLQPQVTALQAALDAHYARTKNFPPDETSLRALLKLYGVEFDNLRDPWGNIYAATFGYQQRNFNLQLRSAGADKKFATDDDFIVFTKAWEYFKPTGELIDGVMLSYHERAGGYIRDAATLNTELLKSGVDFQSLRDPWGNAYYVEFGIRQRDYLYFIKSAGANGKAEPDGKGDDFNVWENGMDYSIPIRARLDNAIAAYATKSQTFPQDLKTLRAALEQSGVEFEGLRDGWNRPLYATFKVYERYSDKVNIVNVTDAQTKQQTTRTTVTPVTQRVADITLRSAGADGKEGTSDDFTLANYNGVIWERSAKDRKPKTTTRIFSYGEGKSAIGGNVTDPNGAVVPGASITATDNKTQSEYKAISNAEGYFQIENIPTGIYSVKAEAPGFNATIFSGIVARSSTLTTLEIQLQVGGVSQTVEVTAAAGDVINTTSSQIANLPINGRALSNYALLTSDAKVERSPTEAIARQGEISTPRLREYFPETLVWQPSLETDASGHAQLKFNFADNITTWKMSVIGTTADGDIGIVEKELRAFQPFFVEHDPPRVLTVGDEIGLPVIVRNYTESQQNVRLEMQPADWFAFMNNGAGAQNINVKAGDAARGIFGLRATQAVDAGKQRVTATGAKTSGDAVEKSVSVHPDGAEQNATDSAILGGSAGNGGALNLQLPNEVIAGSARAELKIYPNLAAHITESASGLLHRPYGCGEQTISSTYPNLLILRLAKNGGVSERTVAQADKNLRDGYARLLNYQSDSGGFTYWGSGDGDVALTAYALRFLTDAQEFVPLEPERLDKAAAWLIKQQQADGSWLATRWGDSDVTQPRRTVLLTAYIAQTLGALNEAAKKKVNLSATNANAKTNSNLNTNSTSNAAANPAPRNDFLFAVVRALKFLAPQVVALDEPHALAAYALAALTTDDKNTANFALDKLRALALREGGGAYWNLETNTPFYGWGLAGRIETTALAVRALARAAEYKSNKPGDDDLINRGLFFLLKNKDRYGVWYSTQATVNVLDALLLLTVDAPRGANGANENAAEETLTVMVNGTRAGELKLPAAGRDINPLYFDLTPFVTRIGAQRAELVRSGNSRARMSAQAVVNYYVPWATALASETAGSGENFNAGVNRSLQLNVSFDKQQARATEAITCRVNAERIGHRGYGMLLAEIGLPPGAEVERASLEKAVNDSGYVLNRYDILPDRVIVYLWSQAGGANFSFTFRPRYGINALNAPSQLYDYYNPEARALVAPVRFNVADGK